jgi:hypothetical protein
MDPRKVVSYVNCITLTLESSVSMLLLTFCITFDLYNSREFLDGVSNYQVCCSVTSVYWLFNLVKIFSIGCEIELFLADLFPLLPLGIASHCIDDA